MASFRLDQVVPWGRSFDEYRAMFALSERDMAGRILGVGDGPASFNAELTRRGGRVVSVDPLFGFGADEIERRIEETRPVVLEQARANRERFVWGGRFADVGALGRARMGAMRAFLDDYRSAGAAGRYVAAQLPGLEDERLARGSFDLAVCSHLLFLYEDRLSERFHIDSIVKVMELASELRIFPLLNLDGKASSMLGSVRAALHDSGLTTEVRRVEYEFQRGGNEMLVVRGGREHLASAD